MNNLKAMILNRRVLLALYALAYGVAMLLLGGANPKALYSPSPYHRLQADALLHGKLNIGDSIYQLQHDLAWHDGQVNHVWGLGVGLWLTPFEALWRLCGQKWFPDRVALGIAFALLACYCGSAGWRLSAATKRPVLGIGFVWLILLCPAVWTLNQGGRLIYEETSLYACIVSLGVLTAVFRVACFGERADFLICATLSALVALVRPTHGIYGLAGMVVCTLILFVRRGQLRMILLGNAIFIAGLLFLAATNLSRFGSPTEFGHRLTVTPGLIVYFTRMGNPMEQASTWEAGKELYGSLFWMPERNRTVSGNDRRIPGKAPYPRWRESILTTFHPSWAAVCLAGGLGGVIAVTKRLRKQPGKMSRTVGKQRGTTLLLGVSLWAMLGAAALVVFYLRFACFSTRYLLDFGPAFTGFAVVLWLLQPRRWAWVWGLVLVVWLGPQLFTAHVPAVGLAAAQTGIPSNKAEGIETFGGIYKSRDQPEQTGISYNGHGWRPEDNFASDVVILALDRPAFVEILVGPRDDSGSPNARPDVYRAMMDREFLKVAEVRPDGDRMRVRFEIPERIRRRAGDELLFLCFSEGYDAADQTSKRMLYSVQWR